MNLVYRTFDVEGQSRCRSLVLEISGKKGTAKAEALASRLKSVFRNREDVKVNRSIKMAEIRISSLDDSITSPEVVKAVASSRNCEFNLGSLPSGDSEEIGAGQKGCHRMDIGQGGSLALPTGAVLC